MKSIKYFHSFYLIIIFLNFSLQSCEDLIDTEDPIGQISHTQVFENENTATAAVLTLYATLRDNSFIAGNTTGLSVLLGLYSDELELFANSTQTFDTFYNHQILASNILVSNMWNTNYNLIYRCNAALEGLNNSENISENVKLQLKGEIIFIRALTYFHLINLFGEVPLVKTTNYEENKNLGKSTVAELYNFLIEDLNNAKNYLPDTFIEGDRIRINNYTVSALLSRIYLFNQNWDNAELESHRIVSATHYFNLENSIEQEFKKESTSTIFQFKPLHEGLNTSEANAFIFTSGPPPFVSLSPNFVHSFEDGDLRKELWIKEISNSNEIWYCPFKYTIQGNSGTSLEYSKIFRLSEQILIRAESRFNKGNFEGAKEDLNIIRARAGLSILNSNSSEVIKQDIRNQRKFELFTEMGARWFDLKRWNISTEILSPIKPGWRETNVLLPIPESEILLNSNLMPQNPGY
jgi:hypothetical protein